MDINQPVSTLMRTQLVTLSVDDPLTKVQTVFEENDFHHIPILDAGKLAGILSKSDFRFFQKGFAKTKREEELENFRMKTHRVKEIMTKGLAKLEPTDKINVALEVFKENMFHAIPVVENERLVGMITTFDIITALAE